MIRKKMLGVAWARPVAQIWLRGCCYIPLTGATNVGLSDFRAKLDKPISKTQT